MLPIIEYCTMNLSLHDNNTSQPTYEAHRLTTHEAADKKISLSFIPEGNPERDPSNLKMIDLSMIHHRKVPMNEY